MSGVEVTPVRAGSEFDIERLSAYLAKHLEGFHAPLRVQQFRGGQSNPTFLLETGNARYVLRKKPSGNLLPSAHMIEREYRVTHALSATGVPVVRQRLLCEDTSVIGTTGRQPRTIAPAGVRVTMSTPNADQTGTAVPGGGTGMPC